MTPWRTLIALQRPLHYHERIPATGSSSVVSQ